MEGRNREHYFKKHITGRIADNSPRCKHPPLADQDSARSIPDPLPINPAVPNDFSAQPFNYRSSVHHPTIACPSLPPPVADIKPQLPSPTNLGTVQPDALSTKPADRPPSFASFWKIKKEPQWDIVASSKKNGKTRHLPSPRARSIPLMWSETWHDAQDALPYFNVSQTLLTSKIPRAQSRCVLLNKNVDNLEVDWRQGIIKFSMSLKYKLDLNRPKNCEHPDVPAEYVLKEIPDAPQPLQFRKLKACRDAGTPVKLLATGDFPSLPFVDSVIETEEGREVPITSELWRNGIVVLGFFWVVKAEEVNPGKLLDHSFDINTGKCSGEVHWDFEFQTCEQVHPNWWCPLGPEYEDWSDNDNRPPIKRARTECSKASGGSAMDVDGISKLQYTPGNLGMALAPKRWPNIDAIRPPQIRNSMLLGWYCETCGKLNPRIKWIETQICPLCKTTTKLEFPQWHRRAHTEAIGPIGTLYRLDDGGGHAHRTGVHAKTARDPENGMTIVQYWIADSPIPILAEIGRIKPRPHTRRGGLPKQPPGASRLGTPQSLSTTSPIGRNNSLIGVPNHPKVQRDVAGSRAMLPADTRVLFVHVTRPQHEHLLAVPDRIFSEFASTVPMERQVNTKYYKAGNSSLSCHYTYLAGAGASVLHTATEAVGWDDVPDCVYNAQRRLTDMQCYNVSKDGEQDMFNQSVFVVGSGGNSINSFRMVHRAEDGPVGYMVFGASCEVELMIGNGDGKRTTKAGAQRRAEVLMAHGDALFTAPPEAGDPPIEIRVKRTGLAVVVVSRYVEKTPSPPPKAQEFTPMEGVVYEEKGSTLTPPTPQVRKRKTRG